MENNQAHHMEDLNVNVAIWGMFMNLVALGRLLLVNGFGDCRWCHDEAHRTQHHHSHEERFSRLRRTLTTSRVFSLSDVHCGAASITAMRSGPALSTFA